MTYAQAKVDYATLAASEGPATAACYIFVTPDGERTMNTFLGASQHLGVTDIDEALVASAKVTLSRRLSLGSTGRRRPRFAKAAEIAHAHGRKVAADAVG